MERDRWQKLELLFHMARTLSGRERDAYLERECGSDGELRCELESLLLNDAATRREIREAIAGEAATALAEDAESAWRGRRLGPWRLSGLLGQGGMGAVYDAVRDDGQFELRVAIKVIRLGITSPADVARFRLERQILARLDHPHIARLLDGGEVRDEALGGSVPYIVMEYVQGVPITEYCLRRHASLKEKLGLFLQIAEVVSFAHQRLVLHRDIKPQNILVTQEGSVKLLDFGVAKLVEQETGTTGAATATQAPMTPEYASPEQVRGEPLTAATDVYSLGVVLYELLGERLPYAFRKTDALEVARVICETQPSPLKLPGELNTILGKALEKDPARRYASVEQFAGDIQRYMGGLPLLARPDSRWYRARKFIARNRVTAGLAALLLLSLAGGLIASIAQSRKAQARANQVRQLANTFLFDVHDSIARVVGATRARELVVGKALQYLKTLEADARGDADLQYDLARAYQKIADVQGRTTGANTGDLDLALANYQKSESWFRAALATRPRMENAGVGLLEAVQRQGRIHAYKGERGPARDCYQEAIAAAADLDRLGIASPSTRVQTANILMSVSDLLRPAGDAKGATESSEQALAMLEGAAAELPNEKVVQQSLAVALGSVARTKVNVNDLQGARKNRQRSIELFERLSREGTPDATLRRNLMLAYGHLGDILGSPTLNNLGERAGAEQAYRHAAELAGELATADRKNQRAQADHAIALTRLAQVIAPERNAEALGRFGEALAIMQPLHAADPRNLNVALNLALLYSQMGERKLESRDLAGALADLRQCDGICRRSLADAPGEPSLERIFMRSLGVQVDLLAETGRRAEARALAKQALALAGQGSGERSGFLSGVLKARANAIAAKAATGAEACQWYRSSVQHWETVRNDKSFSTLYERERKRATDAAAACK